MKPNRVPEGLIQAGFDAIRAWYAAHPDPNSHLDDRTQMRIVLAAALTVYNERVEQPLRKRAEAAETALAERKEAEALLKRLRSPEIADYDSQLLARWISKAIGHGMEAAKLRAELAKVRSAQQDITEAERQCAGDPPWTDYGDGWKSRRPTADLNDLRGPFTGLLGSFGTDDAGEPS